MWNDHNMEEHDIFGAPRSGQYPHADDPEAAFYGMGAREPERWVDADGVPDPTEGTLPPFAIHYSPPAPRRKRHPLVMWLVVALVILLALPFLKIVLWVLTVISLIIVAVIGLGMLALLIGTLAMMRRMRTLTHQMYL